jgi:hypothetical protein
MSSMRTTFVLVLTTIACVVALKAGPTRQPARPVDPIGLIVDALKTHAVVGFSDPHGIPELETFELSVIGDPRVREAIDDIVIESGNARFQSTMDRYIRGESVPYEELRHVWHDTTQVQIIGPRDGQVPVVFRRIRELNARATPPQHQTRVLLGDPPIDWTMVHTSADHRQWIERRDIHGAEVVVREVLGRRHHALVIYGQQHLQRRNAQANYSVDGLAATVASGIEAVLPGQLFTIWWLTDRKTPPSEVSNWPTPRAAVLRGTTLGALDYTAFQDVPTRAGIVNGQIQPVPPGEWRNLPMEDQFDAVLKLAPGTAASIPANEPSDICRDTQWRAEWIRRLTLPGGPPGGGPGAGALQRLRQCGPS